MLSKRAIPNGLLILVAGCNWSYAATLTVAKDNGLCPHATYTTIGAAITAAAAGDEIEICPALYAEQLVITRPVTLHALSANGIGRVLVQPAAMTNLGSLPYQLNNAQAHFHFGQVCNEACGHVLLLLAASR